MQFDETQKRLESLDEQMRAKTAEAVSLLKASESPGAPDGLAQRAHEAYEELDALRRSFSKTLRELEDALGVDEHDLERERPVREARTARKDLTTNAIAPTELIEDFLPQALEELLRAVPRGWLSRALASYSRLDASYVGTPVCLHGGVRPESEEPQVHRYAQALLVAQDWIGQRPDYDFHAGAFLVPAIAALGSSVYALQQVKNGVQRLKRLPRVPSDQVDSDVFELLVAARSAELGHDVELPRPTGAAKTPDVRLHDLPFPCVLECKQQRLASDYERREAEHLRAVFNTLASARLNRGLVGRLSISYTVDPVDVEPKEVAAAVEATRKTLDLHWEQRTAWGHLQFEPLGIETHFDDPVPLYSPTFMANVFGWDYETGEWDGICATVDTPALRVVRARLPFALRWRVEDERVLFRRCRSVMSLLSDAVSQIPTAEMGIVYLSYRESHRPEVADMRTRRVKEQAYALTHRPGISFPFLMVNRLYATAVGPGRPDLIENCIQMSASYADPDVADEFPSRVYMPGNQGNTQR